MSIGITRKGYIRTMFIRIIWEAREMRLVRIRRRAM